MKVLRAALIVFVLAAFAVGGTALARSVADTGGSSQTAAAGDDDGHHGGDDSGRHGGDDGDHSGHHGDDDDDDGRHGDDDDDDRGTTTGATTTGTTTSATTTTTTGGATTTTSQRRNSPARAGAVKRLIGTVGPGFTITLRTPAGAAVRTLRAGTYTVVVRDRSDEHNFHLSGRGVNKATSVDAVATQTWRVKFSAGTYRFVCDPHASSMRGSLRVV